MLTISINYIFLFVTKVIMLAGKCQVPDIRCPQMSSDVRKAIGVADGI
jgi:hypothetical protein